MIGNTQNTNLFFHRLASVIYDITFRMFTAKGMCMVILQNHDLQRTLCLLLYYYITGYATF